MATQFAKEMAAKAWCTPRTSHKVIDTELIEAFAGILDEIWSKPWLGNATTGQLLNELRARVDCNYKTVASNETDSPSGSVAEELHLLVREIRRSISILIGE